MKTIRKIFLKLLLLASIGAIFITISEYWFYQLPSDSGYIEVLLAYGILGYAFLIILSHYKVSNFKGVYLAAAAFGFLVEGIPVPALFTALPFTIVWTSLAWHTLISVTVFWYYFRLIMSESIWWKKMFLLSMLGIGLGAWNTYMWNIVETTVGNETIQNFAPTWFSTTVFVEQFLTGFALFLLGHIIFQFSYSKALPIVRLEKWLVGIFITLIFTLGSFLNLFPFSLALFPLLYICHLSLTRYKKVTELLPNYPQTIENKFGQLKLSFLDYLYTFLIPIFAIGTYHLMLINSIEIEMNVLVILTAGPISVFLFIKALVPEKLD